MKNIEFLTAALSLLWVLMVAYLGMLHLRIRRLRRTLEKLKESAERD